MGRTAFLIFGSCLALLSAAYNALQPIQAVNFMWVLREIDGRVAILVAPFALGALISAVSVICGWAMCRRRRTLAMAAVLVGGAILPLLAAPAGHAAVCSVVCK